MNHLEAMFFTAPWCGPCKLVAGKIEDVVRELDCKLVTVDVEETPELARSNNVEHLPTVIWVNNASETSRQVGAVTRSQLLTAGLAARSVANV